MDENSVVVIGSGLTGTIAALTLLKAGVPVVMLESGNTYPKNLHLRFQQRELRRPIRPIISEHVPYAEFVNLDDCSARWIKAHSLGGRSNFWSGIVLRYSEKDFQDGARLHPKYQWPISYQDLEPYYAKIEKLIQVRGGRDSFETLPACHLAYERNIGPEWQAFEQECCQRDRSLAVLPDVYGPSTIASIIPTPQNVAVRLTKELQRFKTFRLISNAHVSRIQVSKHHAKAEVVEYIDKIDNSLHQIKAKAVILAAGSLSSTQILLNSNCPDFPQGLGNSQGLLGRYLHDHPMVYSRFETDFIYPRLDDGGIGGLYVTRKSYACSQPLQSHALLLYGGVGETQQANLHKGLTLGNRSLLSNSFSKEKCYMFTCCFGIQVPRYENHVALHPTQKDCFGLPLLQISTRFNAGELENMRQGRELIPEILSAIGHKIFQSFSQLQPPGTSVHYGGTARMHNLSQYGVLDRWNRLHDINNLLVVDASCFTICSEKNPTLTAMAISMRAADRLIQEHRS